MLDLTRAKQLAAAESRGDSVVAPPGLIGELVARIEVLEAAMLACRKYADATLTDDPNDGLALVIEKIVCGRMGPLRDAARAAKEKA